MLDAAPDVSGATPACLYFVADKDSAVAANDVSHDFEVVFWRRYVAAHAEDRFGNKRGNLSGRRSLNQFFDVARAFERAGIRLCSKRAAITVRRVCVYYAGDERRSVL